MSQKATAKFIYRLTMTRSKRYMKDKYGEAFWKRFRADSDEVFRKLIKELPDIGKSMFAFNYAYAPGYVAWYKAMEQNGLDAHERDILMLVMNEKMLTAVPKLLLHSVGKAYMNNMRKGSKLHVKRQSKGELHPLDWRVEFENIDKEHFNITITDCGFVKYAKEHDALGMLPAICQVDYMISYYMNVGFERTKTLGAGCECCDGHYCLTGTCDWDIEQRLKERR